MFNWILSGVILPCKPSSNFGGNEKERLNNVLIGCEGKIYIIYNLEVVKTIKVNDGVRKMLVIDNWLITGEAYGHVNVIDVELLTVINKTKTDKHILDII